MTLGADMRKGRRPFRKGGWGDKTTGKPPLRSNPAGGGWRLRGTPRRRGGHRAFVPFERRA